MSFVRLACHAEIASNWWIAAILNPSHGGDSDEEILLKTPVIQSRTQCQQSTQNWNSILPPSCNRQAMQSLEKKEM